MTLGRLYFRQCSATRSRCLTQLHYANSQVTNRGPNRILYLLVVDENGNDLFPHEGWANKRGRKRISLSCRYLGACSLVFGGTAERASFCPGLCGLSCHIFSRDWARSYGVMNPKSAGLNLCMCV